MISFILQSQEYTVHIYSASDGATLLTILFIMQRSNAIPWRAKYPYNSEYHSSSGWDYQQLYPDKVFAVAGGS